MHRVLQLLSVVFGLVAVSGELAAQRARTTQVPPLAEMMRHYRQIAFGAEFGASRRDGQIIKWRGPVVAELRGPNADRYTIEVVRHFALLNRLTGLRFRVVRPGAGGRPNMIITFVQNGGRGPRDLERACEAWVYKTDRYRIYRATIRISADWRLVRHHCIIEEITQALGLMNDSTYLNPSIFNDNSRQQKLSPWDRAAVRAHYDPRLRPGMTWAQAQPIIRDNLIRQLGNIGATGLRFRD